MKVLSKNICHDLHEGKEVIDILLNSMQDGDRIMIHQWGKVYNIELLGERDGG